MLARWLFVVAAACSAPARSPAPTPPAPTAGVVDPDPDQDRIEGEADLCPRDPENYNGVDDEDGCPDSGRTSDCVWSDVIDIGDRLFFEPGSMQLPARTAPVVDAVAATLAGNPQIERAGVVGGRAATEPAMLASQRADAVVSALIARGVAAARLEPHGFPHPIDDGNKSHVVWFVLLRIDGADVRPASGDARWTPFERDCTESWRLHREQGMPIDCDCRNKTE